MEVSQAWLDENRNRLSPKWWKVDGDEGVTVDEGADGLPDEGWTKKDIMAWLTGRGESVGGYATKAKLLGLVEKTLNPPTPVVEEAPVEEVAEETQITGDEE